MRRPALILVIIVVVAACGDDAQRSATGEVVEGGSESVFDLRVGDCFDDVSEEAVQVQRVPVVPCSQPHDNEIYFEFSMNDAVFPGDDAALSEGFDRCLPEFDSFVGRVWAESDLDLFPITPTVESWDQGDRTVYCALYALDLSKLTGSMRGSGR